MNKFFVGQRVRIVADGYVAGPERMFVGLAGRIVERLSGHREWMVDVGNRVYLCECTSSALEPILPSGHAPSQYTVEELLDLCRAGEGVA